MGRRHANTLLRGPSNDHHPLPPDDHRNTRAVHRRADRLRTRPIEALQEQRRRLPEGAQPGSHSADVTEGSGGVWERLYYDWSDPHHVTLKTIDSNLFGGASGHTYTLTPRADGTTDIDVVLVREGKNLRGLVVASVLGTIGKRSLAKAFANSVKAIEARSRQLYA